MEINYLVELDQLARQEGKKYDRKRFLYDELKKVSGKHFTGIIGPRGAGKTVLLKQLLVEWEKTFYVSLDSVVTDELFDIAKHLKKYLQIEILLLDEIHFQRNYDDQLQKKYDFLGLKVIFTSSVALAIAQSAYDLSRRVNLLKLPLFSLREYIILSHGDEIDDLRRPLFLLGYLYWLHFFTDSTRTLPRHGMSIGTCRQ